MAEAAPASPECITSTSTGNTNTTETDKADEPTPSSGIEVPPEGPSSTHDPTPAGPGPTFNSLREPPELRAHVDGRIKNLVPTRLQGVATSKIGNFAVMHIDVNGTMPSDRSTAARRTSEGTEAQARRAIEAGWQPIRRARSTWHSDDLDTRPLSNPSSTVPITAPASSPPLPPADGPTPQEAKAEQARLLTLLRTLHPLLVVEQLCRGLAYFGGIPGAPPPTHGDFPQSAARNGRGSLLVGWLSEIFPHVDKPDAISPPLHLPPLSSIAGPPLSGSVAPPGPPTGKRPRGRPKGSKSSKVRKDKGVQKRQLSSSIDASSRYADASQQATVVQLNISAPTNPTPRADSVSTGPQTASGRETTATTSGNMAAGSNPASASGAPPTLTGRKRGRPKGSKNRLKSIPETSHEASGAGSTGRTTTVPTTANLLPAPSNFPGVGRSLLMGSQNGFIATQSSLVNVPQDVASLPPPAAMECSPSNGVPPPLVTRDPSQLQSQSPRTIHGNQHPVEPENGSPSRVRVSKRAVQDDNEVSADDPATDEPQVGAQNAALNLQGPKSKRPRLATDSGQQQRHSPVSNELTALPPSTQSMGSTSPPPPVSTTFDSQKSVNPRPAEERTRPSPVLQKLQPIHHERQSPSHGQQLPRQSHHLTGPEQSQHSSGSLAQASSPSRTIGQITSDYGSQPQPQLHKLRQMNFALQQQEQQEQQETMQRQQVTNQIGSAGPHKGGVGYSATGSYPQHPQKLAGLQTDGGITRI